MKIEGLKLVNFLSYSEQDLDLSKVLGPVLLVGRHEDGVEGQSNGAGKSALLDAVMWALYGESRAKSDDDLIRGAEDEMSVTLRFALDGRSYEVVRGKKRGRGQNLWLTDVTGDVRLTGNSVRETQAKIVEVVGMDPVVFANTVFSRQGDIATFAGQPPAKRKDVLSGILQLDAYALHEEKAKSMAQGYEKDAAALGMSVSRLESEVSGQDVPQSEVADLERAVDQAGLEAEGLRGEEEQVRAALEAVRAKSAQRERVARDLARAEDDANRNRYQLDGLARNKERDLQAVEVDRRRLEETAAKEPRLAALVEEVGAKIRDLGQLAERVSSIGQSVQGLLLQRQDMESQRTRLGDDLTKLRTRLGQVQSLGGTCYACRSALTEDRRLALEKEVTDEGVTKRQEYDGLGQRAEALGGQIAVLTREKGEVEDQARAQREFERDRQRYDAELVQVRMASTQIGHLAERRQQVESVYATQEQDLRKEAGILAGRVEALRQDLAAAANCADEVQALSTKLTGLSDKIRALTLSREQSASRLAALRERVKALEVKRQQLSADRERLKVAQEEEFAYRELVRAFGRNGIPALIMDNALAEIQAEVDSRLDRMTGGGIIVQFSTQKELKSGKQAETLDIMVSDAQGERDFCLYSGGEKVRVAMAIRFGLARIISRRAGKRIESVFIDEVSDLDPAGIEAFAAMVHEVGSEYGQIFVVSHFTELKGKFNNVLTVVKGRDGSRIEREAEPAEAVAA